VPERNDAGVAENEIERERKHHRDQHLAAKRHPFWKNKEGRDRDEPRQRFRPAETVAAEQVFGGACARGIAGGCALAVTHAHRTPPA
jgi:hypothetical protein